MKASDACLGVVSVVLALACSSTPTPNTSSGNAGSSNANAGTSTTGGDGSAAGASGSANPTSGGAGASSLGGAMSGAGGVIQGGAAGAAGMNGGGGSSSLPPIEECMNVPSVDRFTQWTASGEGATLPAKGSILVMESGEYVGKVQFVGAEWHVIPVLIANKFDVSVDLSQAKTFTLTYSATAALHVQLRTKSHWSGGAQYATDIPATGGKVETRSFSFDSAGWKSLFDAPALSYADTLKEGMGLVFVGDSENTVVFSGLRIDGYTPPCQ